jgi:chromosome segregation protein
LRNTVEQGAGEAQKMQARTEQLIAHDANVAAGIDRLQSELADAETEVGSLRAQLVDVTETREQIELLGDEAQVARAAAERRSARAAAKLEALEEAVASSRARIGAEHLANVSGVVGALVDLLDVDAGWDAAVKASLGEALASIVVSDSTSARRAIEALQAVDHNGAVLALGVSQSSSTALASGVQSVRSHVRPASGAPAALAALLDSLLSHIGCTDDLDAAIAVVESSSSATVVTRRGDRLSPSGWRLGAADDLGSQEVIDRTRIEVESAVADLARLASEVESAKTRLVAARQQGTQLQTQIDRQLVVVENASDKLTTAINDRRANAAEQQITRDATNETRARLTQYQQRVLELENILPGLEESEAAEVAAAKAQTEERATIDSKSAHLVLRRKDLDVRVAGLREREQFLKQRASDTERRLEVDSAARLEAGARREKIEAALVAVGRLSDLVEAHKASTEARLAELHEMRRRQSDEVRAVATRLDNARRGRHEAEQQLEELRERVRRVDVEEAEARMRLEAAVEMIRRDLEVEPEVAEAAPMPEAIEGVTHADRARVLERDIRLMGPINPLALQEFTELQERHQFLEEQLNDVRASRRELAQVIAAVDVEIQSVFAEAFADVSVNFTNLFTLLFPGGKGKLVLTNPDDMLNTGIEVEAQPPGKTFKKLSLLSGGERSLTALAYLFAVFRSRPSPFYVMDEVEAALDDVNLHRFLGLVSEFRRDAQLIIVSHQKRTMEAADCLMGVSMQPGGSSKVITERSTDALTR